MLDLFAVASINTFIEQNLLMVAVAHIGLVVVLYVFFFYFTKNNQIVEPTEQDEDTFDYNPEGGAMFRSPTGEREAAIEAVEQQDEAPADSEDTDEPVVFNSEINEDQMPDLDAMADEEAEQSIQLPEKEPEESDGEGQAEAEEESSDEKRDAKVQEILSKETEHCIILINRDEIILDLNALAKKEFQCEKEDVEGKKIDEVIFLDEGSSASGSDESEQKQSANALKKNGEKIPVSVELEMEDREFGIIGVTVYLKNEKVEEESGSLKLADVAELVAEEENPPESESTEESVVAEEEFIGEEVPSVEIPEPEETPDPVEAPELPEPVAEKTEPVLEKPSIPLPPPPKKGPAKPLSFPKPPSVARQMDSKTVEMFSNQLNQPLQSILQLAELISNDQNAIPHLKKYAIAIQAKSNRMMSQIEEMSMLVSAQRGQMEVQDKPFNLSKLVSGLVDVASNVANESGQSIQFSPDDQDLIVVTDVEYFQKLISNLINITLHTAEQQNIAIQLSSETLRENADPSKKISFEGQDLQIDATRRVLVTGEFPSDENTNRFFDISINRTEDNEIVRRLQSSASLNNYISSIRLMKELSRGVGGKLSFDAQNPEKGVVKLSVELSCALVGSYPA